MPEPKDRYEDSYQKRARLQEEINLMAGQIEELFKIFGKDYGVVAGSLKKFEQLQSQISEIEKTENTLREEYAKIQAEYASLPKYDSVPEDEAHKVELDTKMDALHEKISELWDTKLSLFEEQEAIMEEQPGQLGDFEGTLAIVKMKTRQIEEIRRQLDELDAQE